MIGTSDKKVRVAILDLYQGEENEGMRCIRELLQQFSDGQQIPFEVSEFNVRPSGQVPGLDHDIYISSGGPGSPLDSEGSPWEVAYFKWLESVLTYNADPANRAKKQVFLICHSLQIVCRYFGVATVNKRKSTAFGIFPVHTLPNIKNEPIFRDMPEPFYAVDSRDYQIVQPNLEKLAAMGARILAIEKERPHVPLERAVMAVRFNENIIGTQFHPEADAKGMAMYLQRPDKKEIVISHHGEEKWKSMIEHLNDPDKIMFTYNHVIPNFLKQSLAKMAAVAS